eukprot:MONOS_4654.1-p1 / transcript=MONOS_4654.1 / gene=MONOS_4654 / organism=Monocercomonoides_exilis_PA203 / gene_product=unspecified product / transcript_product=unspecified product / location=Mono_scaffold00126:38810-40123(+) / protein_length=375 / sequence_SO=supercontig / SO=protein_coding / is_pseudo=false
MDEMIEDKILSWENAILILKNAGFWKIMKDASGSCFYHTKLNRRFEKMIIDEYKKKEKDEALLADLCECYLTLESRISYDLKSICVPCLVKAGLKKGEDENTQKEVEMAFLALSNFSDEYIVREEIYINKIKMIIKFHQKQHILTRLAYQSVWMFLIFRIGSNTILEKEIANGLHFIREAAKELEELTNCVNWKREKEAVEDGKETKEELIILRWLETLNFCYFACELWSKDYSRLIFSLVHLYRAAKEYSREIRDHCIARIRGAAISRPVEFEDLLNGGAVDLILEEFIQPNADCTQFEQIIMFFGDLSSGLKGKMKNNYDEAKRKDAKRKIFEKMEVEGYEDCITGFRNHIVKDKYGFHFLIKNIEDYFIFC